MKGIGTTTITVSGENDGKQYMAESLLSVVGMTITVSGTNIPIGETGEITAIIEPSNALNISDVEITWQTYNNSEDFTVNKISETKANVTFSSEIKPY